MAGVNWFAQSHRERFSILADLFQQVNQELWIDSGTG
jgi:hypothetical protein